MIPCSAAKSSTSFAFLPTNRTGDFARGAARARRPAALCRHALLGRHHLPRATSARGDLDAIAQAAASAGETLAAIHRTTLPKSGWVGPGLEVTAPLLDGAHAMPRFVDRCLASPNLQARMPVDLRDEVHRVIWSALPELDPLENDTHLVHGDFNKRNVLVREVRGLACRRDSRLGVRRLRHAAPGLRELPAVRARLASAGRSRTSRPRTCVREVPCHRIGGASPGSSTCWFVRQPRRGLAAARRRSRNRRTGPQLDGRRHRNL